MSAHIILSANETLETHIEHYARLSCACCVVIEPGVLHFLKMIAENKDGMSKPVYRAETPGGVCVERDPHASLLSLFSSLLYNDAWIYL